MDCAVAAARRVLCTFHKSDGEAAALFPTRVNLLLMLDLAYHL
jgi:hypothetical protein